MRICIIYITMDIFQPSIKKVNAVDKTSLCKFHGHRPMAHV